MNHSARQHPNVPLAYRHGYEKGTCYDPSLANSYMIHTMVGDPVLDPVIQELSGLPPATLHQYIAAGIEGDSQVLCRAPKSLINFFDTLEPPEWVCHEDFNGGIRAFQANSSLFVLAFVSGVLVEGFTTLISKSFCATERVLHSPRRLRQNNRHFMEIFLPDGLRRYGDGWKLSVRIRFVHARLRNLLEKSNDWNGAVWGKPISAAHLGYAIAVFSVRLLSFSERLGAVLNDDERKSVLAIWRYVGYIMGIPETILFANGAEAQRMHEIGRLCEPAPDADSVAMANALIRTAPTVAGVGGRKERSAIRFLYRISRALIGDDLADGLEFPQMITLGVLPRYRIKEKVRRAIVSDSRIRAENAALLMQLSEYDRDGLSYRLPDHVKHFLSSEW